ncbi:MAG: hypothetical protein A2Z20_05760 [Bdellovibrionales bacterium RBG_16_40_8]|nr:MAG: hypothetical protein A2Z20_05760 [Bdellovibrionales bacterium RBG_16_40_8]
MIERSQSRNKKNILTRNGHLLCSQIDPMREAQRWVDKHRERLSSQKRAIILGVGCGYHLVALEKMLPALDILAIDTEIEPIDFTCREHSLDLMNTKMILINNSCEFKENQKIQNVVKTRYDVLKFAPATAMNEKTYALYLNYLVGRTEEGLQFLLSHRPNLKNALNYELLSSVGNDLISIKTIEAAAIHKEQSRENLIFLALRELVK